MIRKYLIYFLLLCFVANISYAKVENFIVVKVDNQIITNFEIKNKILSTLTQANREINQKNINSLKKQALSSLIQIKLKFKEISKYNFEISENQMNQYLNSISSNNIKSLKERFDRNNIDFNLFLEEIKTELKWQKFIYEIYAEKIDIDPNQLKSELESLVKRKKGVKEFNISEIEIFIEENEQIEERINNIKSNIENIGFEQTAMSFSSSPTASKKGKIGWINSNALSKDILIILDKMKKNEISKPLERQNSVLFLKINDIKKKKFTENEISKLQDNIITQKKNELFNLYSKSHLSKIRNNSLIEFK